MPLEDALILITKNFDSYMRGDKFGIAGVPMERHPENMQVIDKIKLFSICELNTTQIVSDSIKFTC